MTLDMNVAISGTPSNPSGKIVGADIALNPNNKEVIVGGRLAVEIYSFPEIY